MARRLPELFEVLGIQDILPRLRSVDRFRDVSSEDVSVQPLQTLPHSEVYRVRVAFPAASLILKSPGPQDPFALARREQLFYRRIAPQLPPSLAPRCVFAASDGDPGWLLLEDVSATHRPIASGRTPTRGQCESFVHALSALHGTTHARRELRDAWAECEVELRIGTLGQRLALFEANLDAFMSVLGESFDERTQSFLRRCPTFDELFGSAPLLRQSIVHGDAHYANALYSESTGACLIDWGMPMLGFGEIDLAHAIALNLPRDPGRGWEPDLLRIYLEGAAGHGISIDEAAFRDRYRLGVLYAVASPVSWWRSGLSEALWRPALSNVLDAARDLGLAA